MRNPVLGIVAIAAMTSLPAFSQTTYSNIGGTTFGSDGYTGQRIGDTTFHTFGNGSSGTSLSIGGTTFHDFGNNGSGTSQRIGDTTFHDFGGGRSGISQRIGNTTFHNIGGKNVACQTIGSTVFCN